MRVFKILNITCKDGDNCSKTIIDRLELNLGIRLQARNETDTINGHVSISHKQRAHKVWVFVYDSDNIHESDRKGRLFTQPNIRCKRASNFPTRQLIDQNL